MDVSDWEIDEFGTTKGNRTKFVAYPDRRVSPIQKPPYRYYWKESLNRYPLEFWSEVLAYHIGAVVGVAVPPCFPATFNGDVGSLSLSLLDHPSEELIHGGDLILQIAPNYDREKGNEHSVQLVLQALDSRAGDTSLYASLFRQFVLDALIGNQDRHQDNWGVSKSWSLVHSEKEGYSFEYKYEVLPAFDNGSSLGRELEDVRIAQMLRDPSRLESYIARGKAHIRWESDGNLEHISHEALMRQHLYRYPRSRKTFEEIIEFDDKSLKRAISRVCSLSRTNPRVSLELSPEREEFLKRLILLRRDRLRDL